MFWRVFMNFHHPTYRERMSLEENPGRPNPSVSAYIYKLLCNSSRCVYCICSTSKILPNFVIYFLSSTSYRSETRDVAMEPDFLWFFLSWCMLQLNPFLHMWFVDLCSYTKVRQQLGIFFFNQMKFNHIRVWPLILPLCKKGDRFSHL
jgi:hypothetical protein